MKERLIAGAAATVAGFALASPAYAGDSIEFDNGVKLDWRLSTTYTVGARVEGQSGLLTGAKNAGANDGDNNFRKGALTANRVSALLETALSKGDSGLVFSGSTFYDNVYHRGNDNPGPVNKAGSVDSFTGDARYYHGGYTRLLDLYGYTSFDVGDSSRATVRLGQHVVSWGEALFFPSISLAQGPADGTKTGIPGTETKDQLLPEDQISGTLQLTPKWSVLAHYQFNFHETLAPAPGSYLNSSDGVGPGGVCLSPYINGKCSFGSRLGDIRPPNAQQWGVGTRYRITNETELGLYYLNYQDRTPIPEINAFAPGGTYQIRYFDNIKLTGATFSTTFGPLTMAGEFSYKQGAPALVNTVVNPATGATIANPTRANVAQLNLNTFANLGRTPLSDQTTFLAEVAWVNVANVDARKAPGVDALGSAAAFFPASNQLSFTNNGVAASATLILGYPGLFGDWDMSVPISYAQQIAGRTLTGGVGGQGDKRFSIGANFTYRSNFQIGLTYLGFFGSPSLDLVHQRLLTDRDQISLTMKYAF